MLSADLHPELLPYKHRLTPRFHELRGQLVDFIATVVLPARAEYARQRAGNSHLTAAQPPLLKELQAEARKRGLWNLFLPEVSRISVLEYSPIAEMLGAVPLANLAMNCSAVRFVLVHRACVARCGVGLTAALDAARFGQHGSA